MASNRSVEENLDKKINYFIPETKPVVSTKNETLKIKINKCDMYESDRSEKKLNKSRC